MILYVFVALLLLKFFVVVYVVIIIACFVYKFCFVFLLIARQNRLHLLFFHNVPDALLFCFCFRLHTFKLVAHFLSHSQKEILLWFF